MCKTSGLHGSRGPDTGKSQLCLAGVSGDRAGWQTDCGGGPVPQYRDVQALFDAQGKVHPADLWPIERRLRDPELGVQCAPLAYDAQQRKILDAAVLQIVRGDDIAQSSMRMRDVCLGYAQAQTEAPMRIFWKVAAAYFDAMAHGLLKVDIYSKRVASRVLMVSVALAKGDPVAPERLLQDMLFFCAQARTSAAGAQDATV